ncbi:serine protease [Pleurocapsa sp. PCC 7319]|uniref:S1 family peptidase n=1 Tax=Pleurocapsa sp. PCC 7319 TaxID=118161 RepID=UPI0003470B12|nr:serine protease [Pleurocapsa sp. PCC 7319]
MKDRNLGWKLIFKLGIGSLSVISAVIALNKIELGSRFARNLWSGEINWHRLTTAIAQELASSEISTEVSSSSEIYQLLKSSTVRVVKTDSAGSGVIINREGSTYSVLTNWHVVDSNNPLILTVDDQQHQLVEPPQQIKNADLALLRFHSEVDYSTAKIETQLPQIGDTVYAAGFPLAIDEIENSLELGNEAFRLIQGEVSIVPAKSLPQGYQLGYTNETEVGMSGSPIFNAEGSLVGIHGRGKYRDPNFGVYIFEDGSEPPQEELEQMIKSSWGIPISVYSELAN